MTKNSRFVHEGLACFREWAWYEFQTDDSDRFLNNLPPDYREAFEWIRMLLPGVDTFDGLTHFGLSQPVIHLLCDALGEFLMNTPVLVYYADWTRLWTDDLPHITRDSPDERLRHLVNAHWQVASLTLSEHYLKVWKSFFETLSSKRGLDSEPALIDACREEVVAGLNAAVPSMTASLLRDREQQIARLVKLWSEQLPKEHVCIQRRPSTSSSVPYQRSMREVAKNIYIVPMNDASVLRNRNIKVLRTCEQYLQQLQLATQLGNVGFDWWIGNPSGERMTLSNDQIVNPGELVIQMVEVSGASFGQSDLSLEGHSLYHLDTTVDNFLQKQDALELLDVVHYIPSFSFEKMAAAGKSLDGNLIIRIVDLDHCLQFLETHGERFRFETHLNHHALFFLNTDRCVFFCPVVGAHEIVIGDHLAGRQPAPAEAFQLRLGSGRTLGLEQIVRLAHLGLG